MNNVAHSDIHADVTLGASTVLAACVLIMLLASYVWLGAGLARFVRAELPSAVRAGMVGR